MRKLKLKSLMLSDYELANIKLYASLSLNHVSLLILLDNDINKTLPLHVQFR